MKGSERFGRSALAALLALVLALVWSPLDHASPSSIVHAAWETAHEPDAHPEASLPSHGVPAHFDVDCHASPIACCGMAHCQPGISPGAYLTPQAVAAAETAVEAADRRLGEGPKLILPPPRRAAL